MHIVTLAMGLILSSAIALLAYRAGSLSTSGAVGAILTGTLIFGLGGLAWGILLITFFVSSSVLSRLRPALKAGLAGTFAKSGRRDLVQALANGGWGALLAVAVLMAADRWPLYVAFAGAMAAVTADTWATELGVLGPRLPRLITSGRQVAVGTSGAVSAWGTLAAAVGALFIGVVALLVAPLQGELPPQLRLWLPLAALLGGLAGSVVDSLLGATVQGIFWCERDAKETEKRIHTCGERTRMVRGWAWLDNDGVNFLCSIVGSAVAWAVWAAVR